MSEKTPRDCECSFCLSLGEPARRHLCAMKKIVRYQKQKLHYLSRKKVILITCGNMITIRTNSDGKYQAMAFLHEGDFLSATSLFNAIENEGDICVYALTDCEACVFSVQDFLKDSLSYPDIVLALLKNTAQRFGEVIRILKHVSLDNSESRILNLLNLLFEEKSYIVCNHDGMTLPISHEELAMFVGLNRVTTTRAIDNLQKQGLVATGRRSIKKINASAGKVAGSEKDSCD